MKNTFKATYAEDKRIETAYDLADRNNDEAGKAAARTAHRELEASLTAAGKAYRTAYLFYADAQRRGNELIDISKPITNTEAADLVNLLRENGIEAFTFSSTWSSAVETAWAFQQNGCRLEGMAEINGDCRNSFTGDFDRVHAFIFRIA